MFYLREVSKLFGKHPITNITLALLTIVSFFGAVNYTPIQARLSSELPRFENEHYFNALVDSKVSTASLLRKVKTLPGVKSVREVEVVNEKKNLERLNKELTLTAKEKQTLSQMKTVRIALLPEVSGSSIKLIREYLKRLAGPSNITLGSVKKRVRNEQTIKNILAKIKKWPLIIGIGTCLLFWLTFFLIVRKQILQVSYIIENFQRKENVAFKISVTYMVMLILISTIASFVLFMPNIYSLVIASLVFVLFSFSVIGSKEWARA